MKRYNQGTEADPEGETPIRISKVGDHAKRSPKTYGANEYPDGSVPFEEGPYGMGGGQSRLPGKNRITVCRVRR